MPGWYQHPRTSDLVETSSNSPSPSSNSHECPASSQFFNDYPHLIALTLVNNQELFGYFGLLSFQGISRTFRNVIKQEEFDAILFRWRLRENGEAREEAGLQREINPADYGSQRIHPFLQRLALDNTLPEGEVEFLYESGSHSVFRERKFLDFLEGGTKTRDGYQNCLTEATGRFFPVLNDMKVLDDFAMFPSVKHLEIRLADDWDSGLMIDDATRGTGLRVRNVIRKAASETDKSRPHTDTDQEQSRKTYVRLSPFFFEFCENSETDGQGEEVNADCLSDIQRRVCRGDSRLPMILSARGADARKFDCA